MKKKERKKIISVTLSSCLLENVTSKSTFFKNMICWQREREKEKNTKSMKCLGSTRSPLA